MYAALSERDVLPVMKFVLGLSVPAVSHICAGPLYAQTRGGAAEPMVCGTNLLRVAHRRAAAIETTT